MKWSETYKKKVVSAEEAVSIVRTGNRIYTGGNAATPYTLLRALGERKDELYDVEVTHVLLLGQDPLSAHGMDAHFRHNSLFVGPADRKAVNEGRADYIPIFLSEIPKLFTSGEMPLNVAMLHCSTPDEYGFMSFGLEVLSSKAAVSSARNVIVQVNDQMPRVLGDSFIHVSKVKYIVEVTEEIPTLQAKESTDVETTIGEYIADLIPDGATLQLGIGGIPNAVLKGLDGKRNLGVHTEMVSDGVMDCIEQGIVTGEEKSLHPGKVIATFILGSRTLYDFVDDNPMFELHPAEYTNNPFVISQNEKMVAINSAIEVDLTGQVCSDSIGTTIYSGFGGQVDFVRGAARSKGGKPIIALPSTAKNKEVSRIVSTLREGSGVVTNRADVHYVVTEYGVAYLHGKNLRQRAHNLISIAHPRFRDELRAAAKERRLI